MAAIDALNAREILDSRGNPTIEVEVLLDDGNVSCDRQVVLERWKSEFRKLLTPPSTEDPEKLAFAEGISKSNREREDAIDNDEYACSVFID